MIKQATAFGLLFLFFLPFIILIYSFQFDLQINWLEFMSSLGFTFLQAFASAVLTVFFGLLLSVGFLGPSRQWEKILLVTPNFLPVIIVISSLVTLLSAVYEFPYGFWGIVLVHVCINVGFVTLTLAMRAKQDMPRVASLARVLGAKPKQFLLRAYLPLLKQELLHLFAFVFVICFFSFATPLMAGDFGTSTLEVLIYEHIKIDQNWAKAISISLMQVIFCFAFVLLLHKIKTTTTNSKKSSSTAMAWLQQDLLKWMGLVVSLVSIVGLFYFSLPNAWPHLQNINFTENLYTAGLRSILLSLLSAAFIVLTLCLVVFACGIKWFESFVFSYAMPSTVLLGFVFLLIGGNAQWLLNIKYAVVMALIYSPIFYRLFVRSSLLQAQKYLNVAQVIGANESTNFFKVTWPFVRRGVFLSAFVGALWACGDFALATIIFDSQYTLALVVKSLLSSYRLDLAMVSLWFLIILMLLVSGIFLGVRFVTNQKPSQNLA